MAYMKNLVKSIGVQALFVLMAVLISTMLCEAVSDMATPKIDRPTNAPKMAPPSAKANIQKARLAEATTSKAITSAPKGGQCQPGFQFPSENEHRTCTQCPSGAAVHKNPSTGVYYCVSCPSNYQHKINAERKHYCAMCPNETPHMLTNKGTGVLYCVGCPTGYGPEFKTNPQSGVHYCEKSK
jgi:hypothetical protein